MTLKTKDFLVVRYTFALHQDKIPKKQKLTTTITNKKQWTDFSWSQNIWISMSLEKPLSWQVGS